MADVDGEFLDLVRQRLTERPVMAEQVEMIAAGIQGKGDGARTVEQEVNCLLELLGYQPRLAVDIGGNVGNYTAELRRRNPDLEIHTFEPSAVNLPKLSQRFSDDPSIKLIPLALSDRTGTATLFSNAPGSELSSLTQRNLSHFNIVFDTKEAVKIIRFEDYWKDSLHSRQLDVVKLDIEGHELAAIKGFGDALEATRVMQFEFGGCNIDTRTYFQDFWYCFKERLFTLYRITPFGPVKIPYYKECDEFFSTSNYVAVNQRNLR